MNASRTLHRLGKMPVAEFMARHWQRAPVCIRQALAGAPFDVSRAQLLALAGDASVESRLVSAFDGRWQVRYGPFARKSLPALARARWTLLVQGVDLHERSLAQLAARFRFLPAARFDDVMISYATDGGGVGPHVDQYDVFLLQAHGRRRWRTARRFDPQLVEGLPLRILANFRHEQEWLLEPGDLLYLPPGVAHEGVAQGECITISVGFRQPPWQELAETWYELQGRVAPRTGRMPDTARRPTRAPARLPGEMIDSALRELRRLQPTRRQAQCTLLEHLTEPKPTVVFDRPHPALGQAAFARLALRHGVRVDLRTRMLYAGKDLAINGELQEISGQALPALHALADRGQLAPEVLACVDTATTAALIALLHDWYCAGWLQLPTK